MDVTNEESMQSVIDAVAEKYGTLIEALYTGKDDVHVEAKVTYEDGRTTTMKANLKIRDVDTY